MKNIKFIYPLIGVLFQIYIVLKIKMLGFSTLGGLNQLSSEIFLYKYIYLSLLFIGIVCINIYMFKVAHVNLLYISLYSFTLNFIYFTSLIKVENISIYIILDIYCSLMPLIINVFLLYNHKNNLLKTKHFILINILFLTLIILEKIYINTFNGNYIYLVIPVLFNTLLVLNFLNLDKLSLYANILLASILGCLIYLSFYHILISVFGLIYVFINLLKLNYNNLIVRVLWIINSIWLVLHVFRYSAILYVKEENAYMIGLFGWLFLISFILVLIYVLIIEKYINTEDENSSCSNC